MGDTIRYYPPRPPYPTGKTSASRHGLELREGNKTIELVLKTVVSALRVKPLVPFQFDM